MLAGVVEWQRDVQGRVPFKMDLIDSEGMSIFTIEGHTDVEAQPPGRAPAKTQFVLPLTNVMFPSPGHYQMRININGQDIDGPSMYLQRS